MASSYTAFLTTHLSSTNINTNNNPSIAFKTNNNLRFNDSFRLKPRCQISNNNNNNYKSSSLEAFKLLKSSPADRYTKKSSSIVVIGLNYHTAPIEIREKLSIPEAQWPRAITELCDNRHIEDAAVLSTCNRMEIYVVALSKHMGVKEVTEWMSKMSSVEVSEICQHRFLLYDEDAARHLFEVASGLDSIVLGEGQIMAQVKQVGKMGEGVPGFGRKIDYLFKYANTAGKRVRTETSIATGSVSVSSAAVELALKKLPECSRDKARMLVVGAGKMGKLVIKHLAAKGCRKIVVVNRTEERVDLIRGELKDVEIVYKPLSEMLTCASEADVVFTCTAFETILFSKDQVKNLQPASSHVGDQRLFIDISVPRNVESCVSDLDYVQVYNVDDLKEVVANNKEDRLQKAMEAQAIIAEVVKEFEGKIDGLEAVPTIRKLRAYSERIRASEVEKFLSKNGARIPDSIKEAVIGLSRGIMNEMLSGPMKNLRCGGSDSPSLPVVLENMHAVNRIYSLDTEIPELEQKLRPKK